MRTPTQQAPRHEFKQDAGMAGVAWVQTLMLAAVASAALLVVAPAEAAPASNATAAATLRYQQDRATCISGKASEDRATCLKEVEAAFAEAKHGGLKVEGDSGRPDAWEANAKKRCVDLPAEESKACMARMQGAGSSSGSVEGGGILRELVTVQPAGSAASHPVK
jgi:hypothetical protein